MVFLLFLVVICLSQPLPIPGAPSVSTEDETSPPVTSPPDTSPPDTSPPTVRRDCGSCIIVGDDTPPGGCEDLETMTCVCIDAEEISCCTTKWTSDCIDVAMNMCNCVVPTPAVTFTPTVPPSPAPTPLQTATPTPRISGPPTSIPTASPTFGLDCGDCTAIHEGPPPGGCTDPATMECVCLGYLGGLFFGCCSYIWDDICVLLAQTVCNCETFTDKPKFFKIMDEISLDTSIFDDNSVNAVWRLHCQRDDKFIGDLLYRASTHGFDDGTFHSKCDNKGPTLTIITTTTGHQFGGYTSMPWTSGTAYYSDPSAYIFGFENGNAVKMTVKSNKVGNSVYHRDTFGPAFGGGHDFCTSNNLKSVNCNTGHTYERTDGGSTTNALTCGGSSATISDVEVFRFGLCI